jgi:hypothetical protein
MKKLIVLPLIAATAFGLVACTKQATTENVSVNETSMNVETPAADENLVDNATLDNGANTADALTNG